MFNYLIPFERVGQFILNSEITNYTEDFNFDIHLYGGTSPSEHYSLKQPEITLFVNIDNKRIEEVAIYEELIFKGRNLIGLTIEEFISHTEENYIGEIDRIDFEDDNIAQYIYEFENIGLQVWEKNKEIITIIVFGNDID
jgi:hypothetical protein